VSARVLLTREHPSFPKQTLRVDTPPQQLWAEGDVSLLERPLVAIVGSRTPSPYGRTIAFEAARDLAQSGVVVVSGAAVGLDTLAHEGAMAAGGGTIAVLGFGLDHPARGGESDIIARVAKQGLVLSEYAARVRPARWTFPARNRIICGLSRCLLVVEGRAKGGTSNSVEWATSIGQQIFAVPGRLDEPMAEGPNLLIQHGASIYVTADDVLDCIGLPTRSTRMRRAASAAAYQARAELSGAEATLYDLLTTRPVHVDELAVRSALEPGLLLAALSSLELQGLARQLPGKHFALAA
jgi:DNA processing protein